MPGRTFDVQIVNSKENHAQDYLAAAVDTAMHIHLNEPAGDVLIFLTGQAEIDKVPSSACNPSTTLMDLLDRVVLLVHACLLPVQFLRCISICVVNRKYGAS